MTTFSTIVGNFIPEAQQQLQTEFTRSVESFPVVGYATVEPTDKTEGYVTVHDTSEAARTVYSNKSAFLWQRGAEKPRNVTAKHGHDLYKCDSYYFGWTLDDVSAQDITTFDAFAKFNRQSAMLAMTNRTARVFEALSGASWGSNTADVSSEISGSGVWGSATTANNYISKSLAYGVNQIKKATNGVVEQKDLALLISPDIAYAIRDTTEVKDFFKGSVWTKELHEQSNGWEYGLPPKLHGVTVIVDDSIQNLAQEGDTDSVDYIAGANTAYLLQKKPSAGVNNLLSTVSIIQHNLGNLTIDAHYDGPNSRTLGGVTEIFDVYVNPFAGFNFTDVLSS